MQWDMCRLPGELSVEERNLFSVAFKNAVGARRAAHRIVSSIEERERMNENDLNWSLASAFRRKTGDEIRRLCCAVRELLDERPPTSGDARLFFTKMRLDSSRFSAEVLEGAAKTAALKEALALSTPRPSPLHVPVLSHSLVASRGALSALRAFTLHTPFFALHASRSSLYTPRHSPVACHS